MEFVPCSTHSLNCESSDFKDALDIWCLKPHVVNRRLAGSIKVFEKEFSINNGVCLTENKTNKVDIKEKCLQQFELLAAGCNSIVTSVVKNIQEKYVHDVGKSIIDDTNVNTVGDKPCMEIDTIAQNLIKDKNTNIVSDKRCIEKDARYEENYSVSDKQRIEVDKTEQNLTDDKNTTTVGNKRCIKINAIEQNCTCKLKDSCAQCKLDAEGLCNVVHRLLQSCFHVTADHSRDIFCMLRKLLPRNIERYVATYELIFIIPGISDVTALFIPVCTEQDLTLLCHGSHYVRFNAKQLSLEHFVHKDIDIHTPQNSLVASKTWLAENFIVKLKTWSESSFQSNSPLRKSQSLALVNIEEYTHLYIELKKKYGPYFIQIWPESTDPLKFVYEDIAIATYLLLIWRDERKVKKVVTMQSFIDLGCGNGLLVHILTKEGHPGKGVDISKRKIWSLYEKCTKLEELIILPSTLTVDEDWIIGNHSDELTPWIPLIAARSSYCTNYFVLPCCFHDFHSKFHRVNQKKSQYETYLDYVSTIGTDCGFVVEHDTLRIPSTKRICQIGRTRTYPSKEQNGIENIILDVVQSRSRSHDNDEEFKPREINNDPKNCTQVDIQVKLDIIDSITQTLLAREHNSMVNVVYDSDKRTTADIPWSEWNCGGSIHLSELVKLFDNLKELKSQCGGLQTLLKNNRNIFKVIGGMVALRDYRCPKDLKPSYRTILKKNQQVEDNHKTKLCWFYTTHPQGCVLTSAECKFAHGDGELRTKGLM